MYMFPIKFLIKTSYSDGDCYGTCDGVNDGFNGYNQTLFSDSSKGWSDGDCVGKHFGLGYGDNKGCSRGICHG